MRTREFPVLGPDDERVVDTLAVGLDRAAARVLAYLLLREEGTYGGAASRLAVRVGTGLGRDRTADALSALGESGLIDSTPIESHSTGRPRKGWRVSAGRDELAGQVRRQHAESLLDRARTVATAVGPDDAGPPDGTSVAGPDGDTYRFVLNWTPNGFHAPVLYASERGFYGEAGVDVTVGSAAGSGVALERVASGEADAGVVGSAVLCRALDSGRPVAPVALFYQRAMTVLYTVRSTFGERLESVEQLRDRTVAMPAGSETALLARLFLSQAGVVDDADVVETDGEERAALLAGEADVVTGMAADPPELEAEGHTVDSVLVSERFPVPGPALVVRVDTLRDPPATLGALLAGTMRGVVATDHDREAAAAVVAARSEDTVEAEHRRLAVALDHFSESDARRTHGWGWQSSDDWQRLLTALRQTGALSDSPG
jgi:ABC-type nitrate/sulfonate/bicarbonate transport system substrate-binding protein